MAAAEAESKKVKAAAESALAESLAESEAEEAEAEEAEAEEAWWEEAKALEEIFEDWKETIAEEEIAYDCSLKEAKALAADLAALQQVDELQQVDDYGPDEYEEWRKAVRAELESEAEAERGYY